MISVYLVRHAKALDRAAWTAPDGLRPLSKAGRRQAEALAERFGGLPFARLVSSPSVRCVQTLEPLAGRLAVAVEPLEALAEGSDGAGALDLLLELATHGPVAACTHGDVLLDVLAGLREARVPLSGPFESRKGSTWVLETDGRTVRRGTYLPPPAAGNRAHDHHE